MAEASSARWRGRRQAATKIQGGSPMRNSTAHATLCTCIMRDAWTRPCTPCRDRPSLRPPQRPTLTSSRQRTTKHRWRQTVDTELNCPPALPGAQRQAAPTGGLTAVTANGCRRVVFAIYHRPWPNAERGDSSSSSRGRRASRTRCSSEPRNASRADLDAGEWRCPRDARAGSVG